MFECKYNDKMGFACFFDCKMQIKMTKGLV